ncbi:MAG: hypothetical protein FJ217_14610 [Ignavibacteria bacterium]|nr:hypothetical protein [Ignavibacteria bacterium]
MTNRSSRRACSASPSISRFQSPNVAIRDPAFAISSNRAYPREYHLFNWKLKSCFLWNLWYPTGNVNVVFVSLCLICMSNCLLRFGRVLRARVLRRLNGANKRFRLIRAYAKSPSVFHGELCRLKAGDIPYRVLPRNPADSPSHQPRIHSGAYLFDVRQRNALLNEAHAKTTGKGVLLDLDGEGREQSERNSCHHEDSDRQRKRRSGCSDKDDQRDTCHAHHCADDDCPHLRVSVCHGSSSCLNA